MMESLETRRLLAAEGAIYSVNETIDGSGLPGEVTATVSWGDGTESSATVTDPDAGSPLSFKFDYSLDTHGFFKGANTWRRSLLEFAGESVLSNFTDTLSAITPSSTNTWRPNVWHPSDGPGANTLLHDLPRSLRVASNEIIVYAGSRDLPGDFRGTGGPGGVSLFQGSQSFLDTVRARGESGALNSTPTDFAPSIGSLSFDSDTSTDWYFGRDPNGIERNQIDFISVAAHELFHVLGFGIAPSWNARISGNGFTGPSARSVDNQPNNVPVDGGHFAIQVRSADGSIPLMAEQLISGARRLPSRLDLAALDDIGWQLADTSINIKASHRFADNGTYPVEILVQSKDLDRVVAEKRIEVENLGVSNVRPSLTVPADQTVQAGQTISITDIGVVTDPGFRNSNGQPPTSETFTYSIDWGDGTSNDTGSATIDRHGAPNGTRTEASFNGSHQYFEPGLKLVEVSIRDDDGGPRTKTFSIDVTPAPGISLSLSKSTIAENDGQNATRLTIARTGGTSDTAQRIELSSNDPSEIELPASVVIPANHDSASVDIDAIDDALLDGDIEVTLTASAPGIDSKTIGLLVRDQEQLLVELSKTVVREDDSAGVDVTVRRSNTDVAQPIVVRVSGGSSAQIERPGTITIPANQQQVTVKFYPADDSNPELDALLSYGFSADGYEDARVRLEVLDDEPPAFQNQEDRFDVTGSDGVRATDALRVINELGRRSDNILNPRNESANGVYFDVNGDYRVTALDALIVINELRNRDANGERMVGRPSAAANADDDDDEPTEVTEPDGLLF